MVFAKRRTVRALTYPAVYLLLLGVPSGNSQSAQVSTTALPPTDQIVEKMVEMNKRRAEALRSYISTRVYHVENGKRHADLVVRATHHWPERREFTVLSESGSKFLRNRVLKRLLKAELESMKKDSRQQREMDSTNYDFALVGYERTATRELYVLEVTPKVKKKFLFRGLIWVDTRDFGIVRMEGEPAKNPSWWTTKIDIQHSYQKVGDFWLPRRNETVTRIRLFGQSLLTIEYKDYELTEVQALQAGLPPEASHRADLRQNR